MEIFVRRIFNWQSMECVFHGDTNGEARTADPSGGPVNVLNLLAASGAAMARG